MDVVPSSKFPRNLSDVNDDVTPSHLSHVGYSINAVHSAVQSKVRRTGSCLHFILTAIKSICNASGCHVGGRSAIKEEFYWAHKRPVIAAHYCYYCCCCCRHWQRKAEVASRAVNLPPPVYNVAPRPARTTPIKPSYPSRHPCDRPTAEQLLTFSPGGRTVNEETQPTITCCLSDLRLIR